MKFNLKKCHLLYSVPILITYQNVTVLFFRSDVVFHLNWEPHSWHMRIMHETQCLRSPENNKLIHNNNKHIETTCTERISILKIFVRSAFPKLKWSKKETNFGLHHKHNVRSRAGTSSVYCLLNSRVFIAISLKINHSKIKPRTQIDENLCVFINFKMYLNVIEKPATCENNSFLYIYD